MEDKKISLVLTHVQPYSRCPFEVEKAIRDYIEGNKPRLYQLVFPDISEKIINEGEFFDSTLGEIPKKLEDRLEQDKEEGYEIVVAGGAIWMCLTNTFKQLADGGLQPKLFFEGVFPKVPEKYMIELSKYV